MTNVLTWYCPVDGLEHRCLTLAGWVEEHTLYVDGILWVKLRRTDECILVAEVLEKYPLHWVN